jgi:hypothetical protein
MGFQVHGVVFHFFLAPLPPRCPLGGGVDVADDRLAAFGDVDVLELSPRKPSGMLEIFEAIAFEPSLVAAQFDSA